MRKLFVSLLISSVFIALVQSGHKDEDAPIVISLKLSASESRLGEKVIVTEMVPEELETKRIVEILHTVLRIGQYDIASGHPVNFKREDFLGVFSTQVFPELPGIRNYVISAPLESDKNGMTGIKFTFSPIRLGVFYISSTWIRNDGKRFDSNPVTLVVRPPKGATVIKDEWIR